MQYENRQSLVKVASYWNSTEAWIARNHLAGEGITAVVADEHLVETYWLYANAVGGVKVQVGVNDVEKAETLLNSIRTQPLPAPETAHENTAFVVEKCPFRQKNNMIKNHQGGRPAD